MLDLAHGTQFTGSSDITGGADVSVAEGSHVVVITAGAKQNPGRRAPSSPPPTLASSAT